MRNKRKEMGEESWSKYQIERKQEKAKLWRAKNVQNVVDWRRRTKEKLIEYKGGKCQKCGYEKKCPSAYDFHHRIPSEKEFNISGNGITRNVEKLKLEVDKCDLLCCRCHHELHEQEYEKQREETKKRYEKWLFERQQSTFNLNKICKKCFVKFKAKRKEQIFCSKECSFDSLKK
jgi:hypothetical protein